MIRPISFGARFGFGFPGHVVRAPDAVFDAPPLAALPADPPAEAPPLGAPELVA
jgi:hypothetical protein